MNKLVNEHLPGSTINAPPKQKEQVLTVSNLNKKHTFLIGASLKTAIKEFKNGKSPGPDLITPMKMKQLPKNILDQLIVVMKHTIELGYAPTIWRTGKVTFIPKPGKKDMASPRSYRPITLASYFWKLLERIMAWVIETTMLASNPLHNWQHAFRLGYSCGTALSKKVTVLPVLAGSPVFYV